MLVTITPILKERFREIPPQVFYFPTEENPDDWEVFGKFNATRISREKLTKAHFDQIQFISYTTHPVIKGEFMHAVGSRVGFPDSALCLIKKY